MFSAVTVLNCAPYFSAFLGRELCDNLSLILQKPGFSWAAEGSGVERLDLGYRCTWQHGLSYAWWTLPDQRDDHSDSQPLLCDSFLVTEKGLWKQGVLPQLSHDGFTNLLGFLFGFDRKWVPLLPSIHWAERRQLPKLQPVSSKRNQTLLWRSSFVPAWTELQLAAQEQRGAASFCSPKTSNFLKEDININK